MGYIMRTPARPASPVNILLIEDSESDSFLIQEALTEAANENFVVAHAPTLEEAEPKYNASVFDVLLLDMNLPGLSGMDAVEKVRQDQPAVPIIIMTGLDDGEKAALAMQKGVQDYLIKGRYTNEALPRSIRYAIERKRFENQVLQLVHFDQVTGLINREVFLERLEGAIALAVEGNLPLAVLLINLKRFRDVNATLGHYAGNRLLQAVALRLKHSLLPQDALARLEGDEFMLLIAGHDATPENLGRFSQGVIDILKAPFEIDDQHITIGCSVGVATYPACGKDGIELVKHADMALHRAKQSTRNEFQFYTRKLNEELTERVALERELRGALKDGIMSAWYQPIIDLKTGRPCGVETLLRWPHPVKGFISPAVFIPIAEKSDIILEVSEYVMRKACEDYQVWGALTRQPLYVAVNLSTRDLQKYDFHDRLEAILRRADMHPGNLALEITESSLMEDSKQTIAALTQCRQSGASVFVDDFGTGYSSLRYLSILPLDILKVDQSFVQDITTNAHNRMIAASTINLAHGLGLQVVAEGIETFEQMELLRSIGCDKAQGYYFARPMPSANLAEWLAATVSQGSPEAGIVW